MYSDFEQLNKNYLNRRFNVKIKMTYCINLRLPTTIGYRIYKYSIANAQNFKSQKSISELLHLYSLIRLKTNISVYVVMKLVGGVRMSCNSSLEREETVVILKLLNVSS